MGQIRLSPFVCPHLSHFPSFPKTELYVPVRVTFLGTIVLYITRSTAKKTCDPYPVSTARQLLALLKTHVRGDEEEFLSIAMQVAAREARLGHSQVAEEIRKLIDEAKLKSQALDRRSGSVLVLQPRSELANLLSIQQPTIRLSNIVLASEIEKRL